MKNTKKEIDVLAVMDAMIASLEDVGGDCTAEKAARDAVAELIAAANAIAGPNVDIAPPWRKLHALRAALSAVGGAKQS
jgi:hypothetical protein